ncbi:alpha/beta hydrolase [Liquorilactobacillus oeni]|uniref:Alpha/beta hydrolase n=1 Tax=Liquorilactobacillus oeni DSM 19972 TaxID=1423777 RepID=A0A0R1MCP7_9LACO|nr:alpha/beta hydrolase [Liquorilactobacillus oeni]KRL05888.1 hypothetical protein FD46_GL000648 [Liquorilactobacillus oeni DSM 19972]
MKPKKVFFWLLSCILVIAIGYGAITQLNHYHYLKTHYVSSNIPTIFVHGWNGTLHSEEPMAKAAERMHVAKKAMIIHVRPNGQLKTKGQLKEKVNNPIVEVVFDNKRAGEFQDAEWLKNVTQFLKNKYRIKKFNAVGHSMGAYAWAYYNMLVANDKKYPRINRIVLIAGPYDGIINNHKLDQPLKTPLSGLWEDRPNENRLLENGKPLILHAEYQKLLKLHKRFPKQAQVLNIYGNLGDGTNSDGVVTLVSARSLGYLLRKQVQVYHELEVIGPNAQHSRLHQNNLVVNKALINFLWNKKPITSLPKSE